MSAEVKTLRKLSAQHRSSIAALRREVAGLEKLVRTLAKTGGRSPATTSAATESAVARRFSASRLAAHRTKLGLSAATYGALVGVSGATIYNWEQGKGRPGKDKLEALAPARQLSKAEAVQRASPSTV